jgi:hypothetical protein
MRIFLDASNTHLLGIFHLAKTRGILDIRIEYAFLRIKYAFTTHSQRILGIYHFNILSRHLKYANKMRISVHLICIEYVEKAEQVYLKTDIFQLRHIFQNSIVQLTIYRQNSVRSQVYLPVVGGSTPGLFLTHCSSGLRGPVGRDILGSPIIVHGIASRSSSWCGDSRSRIGCNTTGSSALSGPILSLASPVLLGGDSNLRLAHTLLLVSLL